MIILGIESSCDETAAAIVKDGKEVISSVVASSQKEHVKTQGIIPEVAARRQVEHVIPVIKEAIGKLPPEHIDAIAVTAGPGLIGSLLVGTETAKTLSFVWRKPIIPVNHLVGHVYANWIDQDTPPEFPAVAFVVSGGHTDLIYMKGHGKIVKIGSTRDDAAGEAFDKTARLLGLGYPGGPAISRAAEVNKNKLSKLFPRPMADSGDLDLSFSGLKTAVLKHLRTNANPDTNLLAAEIQEAIVDTLVSKSLSAVKQYKPKSFILAGGVSANRLLRDRVQTTLDTYTKVFLPEPTYTTDNAVMIAAAANFNYLPVPWGKITANPSLSIEEKF